VILRGAHADRRHRARRPSATAAVVLEDRRIAAIVPDRPAAQRRRAGPRPVSPCCPGLINCHVHLCLSGDADPSRTIDRRVVRRDRRRRPWCGPGGRSRAGVTTVRGPRRPRVRGDRRARDAVRAGCDRRAPGLLCAGRAGVHHRRPRLADGSAGRRTGPTTCAARCGSSSARAPTSSSSWPRGGVMTPGRGPAPQRKLTLAELERGAVEGGASRGGPPRGRPRHGRRGHRVVPGRRPSDTIEARRVPHGGARRRAWPTQGTGAGGHADRAARDRRGRSWAAGIPEFAVKKSLTLRERHLESFRLALARRRRHRCRHRRRARH